MIEVPPKIWLPKVTSKYTLPEYAADINEGALDFSDYGNCVFKPKNINEWKDSARQDLIIFDESTDIKELMKDIEVGYNVPAVINTQILNIVKKYWDCFAKRGAKRTVIGYEFGIDTGNARPICCKKPSYGPYEAKIIMEQVEQLLKNGWIRRCENPWDSLIVLAPKPHQEYCADIDKFIWRMCVSY